MKTMKLSKNLPHINIINMFLLILILFFLSIIISSFISLFSSISVIKEGLETIVPIYGNIKSGSLYLNPAVSLSIGDSLKTTEGTPIVDISQIPITLESGTGEASTLYQLSGIVDPSSITYGQDMSMQIVTTNPIKSPPPIQIQIKAIINDSSNILHVYGGVPSQDILPKYLLLGSASNQLKTTSGKPISISSVINKTTYGLSGIPDPSYIITNSEQPYIIEQNT
jgi:hypothetical protein